MKHLFLYIALLLLLLTNTQVSHARLTSLGSTKTVEIDGQRQQQTLVRCGTKDHRPLLIRTQGSSQWCDSVVTNLCHKDKLEVGQRVCSLSYTNRLKAANSVGIRPEKISTASELRKEAMDIEDALIKIQAARIELRKRELGLLKLRDNKILQAKR